GHKRDALPTTHLRQSEDNKGAIRMTDKKVISPDQNGVHYYRQGIKKRQQKHKTDALRLLKKAHDQNPDNMDYLSEYVYVMAENGFGNEAEHLIIEAFVKDDFDTEYFYILSQINIIKHDANKAFLYGVDRKSVV